jgi:SSS family solute:Na+ symporter
LLEELFFGQRNPRAALSSMIMRGTVTAGLTILQVEMPFGLDPNLFGLSLSLVTFCSVVYFEKIKNSKFKSI